VIRESRCRPLLAAALPTNRIVPTDLERCREGEQGRRQMLEVAEADLDLEAGFVHVKGAPGMPQITRRACRRERSAFRGFTMARGSRRARPGCTELAVDGGPRVRIHLPPAESRCEPHCRPHRKAVSTTAQSREPERELSCYRVERPRIWSGPPMEYDMLYWALVFFIIAIVAAVFGFGGIAATASSIAQILFFVFLVIFLVTLVMGVAGRRRPPI
jgi:uncharacterized membrane protein YtjA (UPF0391 family)